MNKVKVFDCVPDARYIQQKLRDWLLENDGINPLSISSNKIDDHHVFVYIIYELINKE